MGEGRLEAAEITWKKVAYHTLTHAALLFFVIIYTVIGGVAFKTLEGPNEKREHEKAFKARQELRIAFVNRVKNVTDLHFNDDINLWYRYMVKITQNLERRLDVVIEEDLEPEWNFYSSIFFSGVVISTIGRLNMYMWVNIVCVSYSCMGRVDIYV